MTSKVFVEAYDADGEFCTTEVEVESEISFDAFRSLVRRHSAFKGMKIVDIIDAKDSHLCQYCGSVVKDSKNEDILCDDCYELFGHKYFSEL